MENKKSDKKTCNIKVKHLSYSIELFFKKGNINFSVHPLFETQTDSDNTELWRKENEILEKLSREKFDPIAFHDSLLRDGDHCIFTCGCGVPGCAGFEPCTLAKKDQKEISWLIKNRYYEENIRLILDRRGCEEILKNLIINLKDILKLFPESEESIYGGKKIKNVIDALKGNKVYYNFKRVPE